MPSGSFAADSAWLVLATMAFNLTRAAGTLASTFHGRATTATLRAQLISVAARLARSGRRLRLHLPRDWPRGTGLEATVRRHLRTIHTGPTSTARLHGRPEATVEQPDKPAVDRRPNPGIKIQ